MEVTTVEAISQAESENSEENTNVITSTQNEVNNKENDDSKPKPAARKTFTKLEASKPINLSQSNTKDEEWEFNEEFKNYLQKMVLWNLKPISYDENVIECFGVLKLNDPTVPEQKRWYLYYGTRGNQDQLVKDIRSKYGRRNTLEVLRTPMFSGINLYISVKRHFAEMKWFTKGNIIEAPMKTHFNDQKFIKTVWDVVDKEKQKIYNFVMYAHNNYQKYGGR